jgi:hypothetical protein
MALDPALGLLGVLDGNEVEVDYRERFASVLGPHLERR